MDDKKQKNDYDMPDGIISRLLPAAQKKSGKPPDFRAAELPEAARLKIF
ncbi:MAG: hypothetical protein J6A41_07345 [Ruminiclostridium sp.]|nr:hypothetical protein [Ruminiclostridium sp.]